MKSGVCPKCSSSQIYSGVDVFMKGGGHGGNRIPITSFTSARLDNYVCVECGYVESYISERDKLEKIVEKWPRPGEEHEW